MPMQEEYIGHGEAFEGQDMGESLYQNEEPSLYTETPPPTPAELEKNDKDYLLGTALFTEILDSGYPESASGVAERYLAHRQKFVDATAAEALRKQASVSELGRVNLTMRQEALDVIEQYDPDTASTYLESIVQGAQQEDPYALEKTYVDNLASLAEMDPQWNNIVSTIDPFDYFETIHNMEKKAAITRNEIALLKAEAETFRQKYPYVGATASFIGSAFEEVADIVRTGSINTGSEWYRRMKEIRHISDPDEYGKALKSIRADIVDGAFLWNPISEADKFDYIVNMGETDALISNAWTYGEMVTIGWGGLIKGAMKGGTSIFDSARRIGARTPWNKFLADEMKLGRSATDAEPTDKPLNQTLDAAADNIKEVIEATLPHKSPEQLADNASQAVLDELEINDQILQELRDFVMVRTGRLTEDEMKEAVERTKQSIKARHSNKSLSSAIYRFDEKNNFGKIEVRIQRGSGTPFESEKEAMGYLQRNGLDEGYEVIQGDSGEWLIKTEYIVDERGMIKGFENPLNEPNSLRKTIGSAARILFTAPSSWIGARTMQNAREAVQITSRVDAVFKNVKRRTWDKLPGQERKAVMNVISEGLNYRSDQGKWFSAKEFENVFNRVNGRLPKDREYLAYKTYQQISDVEHFLRNHAEYTMNARAGWRTVTSEGETFNGRIFEKVDELLDFSETKSVRAHDGKRLRTLRREQLDKLYSQGWRIVRRQKVRQEKGQPIPYELVPADDVKDSPLRYQQVGYIEGGHRQYLDKYFVSQRLRGKWADTDEEWVGPLLTRFTAKTQKEADELAEKLEIAREAYRKFKADGGVENSLRFHAALNDTPFDNFLEWEDAIDKGLIDVNNKFFGRFDRELGDLPQQYEDYTDMTGSGLHSLNSTTGRMYYSSRGDRLVNSAGDPAEIVNPFKSQSDAISNAIRHTAWDDFRAEETTRFMETFKGLTNPLSVTNPSGEEFLQHAKMRDEVKKSRPDLWMKFQAHKLYLSGQIRIPSMSDQVTEAAMRRLAESIQQKEWLPNKMSQAILDRTSASPTTAIRGLIYDLHLGTFAVPQLYLQAQSMVAATSLHPVHGVGAWKDLPFFRAALINSHPEVQANVAKAYARATGGDPDEFLEMVNDFRVMGFHNIGNTLSTIDAAPSGYFTPSLIRDRAGQLRQAGRWFAQEGDRYGRIIAYGIARRKAAVEGIDMTTKEGKSWVLNQTEELLFGLNSANNLLMQRGLTSIPTQFWSYQLKMLDSMNFFSGAGPLSRAQKARLFVGQTLMYGAHGVPLGTLIANKYFTETGQELDPETYKLVMNGIPDALLYALSDGEIDVNLAAVAGTGDFIYNTFKDLAENPLGIAAFGVAADDFNRFFDSMGKYARMYSLMEDPDPIAAARATMSSLLELPTSGRLLKNTFFAWQTGNYMSGKGVLLTGNVSKVEAVLLGLLNAKPQEVENLFKMLDSTSSYYKDNVETYARAWVDMELKWLSLHGSEAAQGAVSDDMAKFGSIMSTGNYQFAQDVAAEVKKLRSSEAFYDKAQRRYLNLLLSGEKINKNLMKQDNQ